MLLSLPSLFGQEIVNPFCPPEDHLEVYKVVEQMPLFPCAGCADEDYAVAKARADKAMLDFIYAHREYPFKAVRDEAEGMTIVSFIVEPSGCLSGAQVVRKAGRNDFAESALNTVKAMIDQKLIWVPGLKNGQPVRVEFNLPIKFKLDQTTGQPEEYKPRNYSPTRQQEPQRSAPVPSFYLSADENIEIGFDYDYERTTLAVKYDSYVKQNVVLKLYDETGAFIREVPFKLRNRYQEKVLSNQLSLGPLTTFKLVAENGEVLVEGEIRDR
ncbi:energy transducer TonB [Lewinella sp. W8]|uniref:energy transducer TonB n=1 Tax=Lewinella sp. W8 TaxID=2528208 RepID=UPI0015668E54|nr:energy transducer TonB [Lewinella sp. W8]